MPLHDRVLMGPGPSNPYPEVMQALARPVLGHLDPDFLALLDETCDRLRRVFFGLLNEGIFVAPRGMACLSTPMAEGEIAAFARAVERALDG